MKCEEQNDGQCDCDAVGVDVVGKNLCAEHLAFSLFVQRLCNAALPIELIPDYARLPEDDARAN